MMAIHPQEGNRFSIEIKVDYKSQQFVLTEEQYSILQNNGLLADMEEFLRNINSSEIFKLYAERLAVYGPFFDGHDTKQCLYLLLSYCLIGLPCLFGQVCETKKMREYENEGDKITSSFSNQARVQFEELQKRNQGFKLSYIEDRQRYISGVSTKRPSKYPKSNRQITFIIRNYDPYMERIAMIANKPETELERKLRLAQEQEQQKQHF